MTDTSSLIIIALITAIAPILGAIGAWKASARAAEAVAHARRNTEHAKLIADRLEEIRRTDLAQLKDDFATTNTAVVEMKVMIDALAEYPPAPLIPKRRRRV